MLKFFSSDKPLNAAMARNCFLVNQFATPGLGSVMGGHFVAGIGQVLLAVAGFVLVMAWFALTLNESYKLMESTGDPKSYNWLGGAGALVFAGAWLWALVTSIAIFREARANSLTPPAVPPKFL